MPPVHYRLGGFPPDARLDWPTLIPLLGPAAAAVARYDGVLAAVPHPSVLLAPLATQEAVLSSRIEGTRATMGEVLEYEAGRQFESPALLGDIDEILNYRLAMRRAETSLQELPLCLRVIREAHKVLLDGVRGRDKAPGELRRIPNWIGPPGCAIADATFVPVGAEEFRAHCRGGSGICMKTRRTGSYSLPFCMRSLRRCIRFSTATVVWDACWCVGCSGVPCSAAPTSLPWPGCRREPRIGCCVACWRRTF